jgi:hypothetical protein
MPQPRMFNPLMHFKQRIAIDDCSFPGVIDDVSNDFHSRFSLGVMRDDYFASVSLAHPNTSESGATAALFK